MNTTTSSSLRSSNWRWVICTLLFFATTINYLDRQVLSLTWKDFIAPEFHWTDSDYGTITGFFSLFYAAVSLFAGKFIDWMGARRGYLWAIFIWSLAACMHAGCGWVTMKPLLPPDCSPRLRPDVCRQARRHSHASNPQGQNST